MDPSAGPVQQLAADLRRLRERAGRPGYRQPAAGRTLPTLPGTLAFAGACGGHLKEWELRWMYARDQLRAIERRRVG